jgi:hypothetical protein
MAINAYIRPRFIPVSVIWVNSSKAILSLFASLD